MFPRNKESVLIGPAGRGILCLLHHNLIGRSSLILSCKFPMDKEFAWYFPWRRHNTQDSQLHRKFDHRLIDRYQIHILIDCFDQLNLRNDPETQVYTTSDLFEVDMSRYTG